MRRLLAVPFAVVLILGWVWLIAPTDLVGQAIATPIPFADAKPVFDVLRGDLLPGDLNGKSVAGLEAVWPSWLARRDAAIRARVESGEADSVVNFLTYGTTFTRQPRISDGELAGLLVRDNRGGPATLVPSPVLRARIDDFVTALMSSSDDPRLRFARQVVARDGMDLTTEAGRNETRVYLEQRVGAVGNAERTSRLLDPQTGLADRMTIFRDRGLSSDTSISIDLGIERALDAMRDEGLMEPGSVKRVAVVGPGLDFVDKQNGYDFYPQQTIQPFALIDSLLRLDLAEAGQVRVTAFDLSSRVLQHIESAREGARAGNAYAIVLARSLDQPWTPELVDYWQRFGSWIGDETDKVPPPPSGAGRVEVRGVSVRSPVVLSLAPVGVNIVTERLELPADEQFDLVVATNILLYYDVFEQSLAAANIARMLRPGGFLLTNNRIFELPNGPLAGVGYTDTTYMSLPGIGDAGDRVIWYQKQ